MNKRMTAAIIGTSLAAGLLCLNTSSAQAGTSTMTGTAAAEKAAPRPPKGARAVVRVSPNPTTRRGQKVTITGDCGGGEKLKTVMAGVNGNTVLENIRILSSDPKGFKATATLSSKIGNGVGPVFVDCGDEAGVTLLVTHV
ncbi:hypothetical protein ABGB18_35715 [Nonomuraea sp. B12E4]|uniref:hypothetical protein n=1 Tax=Nonomuraea sp. B12E4 TaxID=3153564 RepID=UPI00325C7A01